MRIIFDHVMESGHFVSHSVRRRLQFCDVIYYLISMPPSKVHVHVCPQCETIVPLRLKVCQTTTRSF